MNTELLISNYLKSRKESLEARGKFVDLDFLSSISLDQLISELLILEYGYLLPKLTDVSWEIAEVEISLIKYNEKYMKNGVNPDIVEKYQKSSLENNIVALVKKQADGTYFLVDGYHRMSSEIKKNKTKILVLIAKSKIAAVK